MRPWIHVTEIVEDVRGGGADSGIGYINTLPDMLDIVPKRDASSRVWSIRDGDFEFSGSVADEGGHYSTCRDSAFGAPGA